MVLAVVVTAEDIVLDVVLLTLILVSNPYILIWLAYRIVVI
jgi:hypothetical protein